MRTCVFKNVGGVSLLALASVCNAYAASSADALVSNIHIVVTNLSPGDGITPQLSFMGYSLASGSLDPLNGYPSRPSPNPIMTYYEPGVPAPSSFPAIQGSLSAQGMSSSSVITSESIHVSSSSTSYGSASAKGTVGSYYDQSTGTSFTLTPYSSFTIYADAALFAWSDGASTGNLYWQNSWPAARVTMNIEDANLSTEPGGYDYLEASLYSKGTTQSARIMSATFSNMTDQPATGSFYIDVDAVATAVPEPSVASLALAGLSVLVAARLRGRRMGNRKT